MKHGRCCLSCAVAVCAALLILPLPAFAQGTEHIHEKPVVTKPASQVAPLAGERPSLVAQKTTDRPRIDGVLDDAAWATAQVIDTFVQQEPQEGQPASDRTLRSQPG